jgi:hypothetical protein
MKHEPDVRTMKHLTDEQLADWLAGDADGDACGDNDTRTHLLNCERCRSEAISLRDRISRYTLAMRNQAASAGKARTAGNFAADFSPRKALARQHLRWAGAGVLALLLAAQTTWMLKPRAAATGTTTGAVPTGAQHISQTGSPMSSPSGLQPPTPMSDDELLEAVNNDLSRDVPQALAAVSAITTARNQIAAASGAR